MYGIWSAACASNSRSSHAARGSHPPAAVAITGTSSPNRVVDGGPDGARRAVDLLERGREALQQEDGAFRAEDRIDARDERDLGDRLVQPSDRGLGLPAERVPAEACLEMPRVTASLRHTDCAILPLCATVNAGSASG